MARFHRCTHYSLAALALGVLIWTSPAAAAGQSMAKDGYVLPPESVQDLFRRDKNLPQLNRLSPGGDHVVIRFGAWFASSTASATCATRKTAATPS